MGRAVDPKMHEYGMEAIAEFRFSDAAKQDILMLINELGIKTPPSFWQMLESISAQYLHYKKTSFNALPRSAAKRNIELYIKELKKTGLKLTLNHRAESALLDGIILLPVKSRAKIPGNSIAEAFLNNSIPNTYLIEAAHIAMQNLSGQGKNPNDALDWYVHELSNYYVEITNLLPTHSVQYNYIGKSTQKGSNPTSPASRFVLCIASNADSKIKNNSVNSVMERVVRRVSLATKLGTFNPKNKSHIT